MKKRQKKRKKAKNGLKFVPNKRILYAILQMVDVAQLVRAPGCGPGGRRFESGLPPHFFAQKMGKKT